MALLSQVITGKQPTPPRLMIYGSEGVGKSTFAANAPKAIFIQTEDGLSEIDCAKLPLVTEAPKHTDRNRGFHIGSGLHVNVGVTNKGTLLTQSTHLT